MSVMILDGRKWFYQWDINQRLIINDHPIGTQVHFSLHEDDDTNAIVMESYGSASNVLVTVPNSLLQTYGQLHVYIYPMNGDEGHTAEHWKFEIRKREKPSDYVYTDTEVRTYDNLEERIKMLEQLNDSNDPDEDLNQNHLFSDRKTGKKYTLYVENGKLMMEATE